MRRNNNTGEVGPGLAEVGDGHDGAHGCLFLDADVPDKLLQKASGDSRQSRTNQ